MKCVVTERDIKVFRFLWKWKISTTAYLKITFFPKIAPHTVYMRLNKLRQAGYLKIYFSEDGKLRFWGLTNKGFLKIKSSFPSFEQNGFKSASLQHDIKSQVVHLGVFDDISSKNVTNVTEQELRCIPEYLPRSVSDFKHRPDGYWIFDGDKAVAIEVELSHKSLTAYYDLARQYDVNDSIKSVLWVVESEGLARRILQQIERFAGGSPHKYSIVYYQDFLKFRTNCKIIGGAFRGEKLIFLLKKMGAACLQLPVNSRRTQALAERRLSNW